MAKSKNGGSRAYIRGRIGSDVYSVGKTGRGAKQQIVRSLAEQVSNPRTESQMFGRMVMSTVMQAVSALKPIIDHSFDGLPAGQPSISEFIRRNYALVKSDAEAHPASGNDFALAKYQEKGINVGPYVISVGSVVVPSKVQIRINEVNIFLTADTLTVGGLKDALGLSADGYMTYVCLDADNRSASYYRIHLATSLADDAAITADNVASLFNFDGNASVSVELVSNTIIFTNTSVTDPVCEALIISEKVNGAWAHSSATLSAPTTKGTSASEALPTYPTGVQLFLNGGDL